MGQPVGQAGPLHLQLSAPQKSNLAKASPEGVSKALRRLSGYATKSRWLGDRNRYRRDTVVRLEADRNSSGGIHATQVADYVASSAPIHACDGWSFLGRSMAAHLHGDPEAAVHLAYYAELRAAMALLATQGMGVFSGRHYVIEDNGRASFLGGKTPTHQAAWLILEHWASTPAAAAALGGLLVPGSQPISEWVSSLSTGASWAPVATDWLRTLGIDLQHFALDRESRNEASYRPSRFWPIAPLPAEQAAIFAEDLWSLLEPIGSTAFEALDRHLLRRSLEGAFTGVTGMTPLRAPKQFERAINASVEANTTDAQAVLWSDFLLRRTESADPNPLVLSRVLSDAHNSEHHLSVMSRAALLLRIASGAVRNALFQSDISLDTLEFWWPSFGIERGLWIQPPTTGGLADGWADIAEAFDVMQDWRSASTAPTYREMLDLCPGASVHLGMLDVVGIWSLAS
jgi:hypothetical protein